MFPALGANKGFATTPQITNLTNSYTSASDIWLLPTSNRTQSVAMTANSLSVYLPNATNLPVGTQFYIVNNGASNFCVRRGNGALIIILQPSGTVLCTLADNTTVRGNWANQWNPQVNYVNDLPITFSGSYILNNGASNSVFSVAKPVKCGNYMCWGMGNLLVVLNLLTGKLNSIAQTYAVNCISDYYGRGALVMAVDNYNTSTNGYIRLVLFNNDSVPTNKTGFSFDFTASSRSAVQVTSCVISPTTAFYAYASNTANIFMYGIAINQSTFACTEATGATISSINAALLAKDACCRTSDTTGVIAYFNSLDGKSYVKGISFDGSSNATFGAGIQLSAANYTTWSAFNTPTGALLVCVTNAQPSFGGVVSTGGTNISLGSVTNIPVAPPNNSGVNLWTQFYQMDATTVAFRCFTSMGDIGYWTIISVNGTVTSTLKFATGSCLNAMSYFDYQSNSVIYYTNSTYQVTGASVPSWSGSHGVKYRLMSDGTETNLGTYGAYGIIVSTNSTYSAHTWAANAGGVFGMQGNFQPEVFLSANGGNTATCNLNPSVTNPSSITSNNTPPANNWNLINNYTAMAYGVGYNLSSYSWVWETII